MRAVEEESKKEEVLSTKLSSNKESEVCPQRPSFIEAPLHYLSCFPYVLNDFKIEVNQKIIVY